MTTYKTFKEADLIDYKTMTDKALKDLWQQERNEKARITLAKRRHNLIGDVYLLSNGTIQDMTTHKAIFGDSNKTIEEMAQENIAKELEQQAQQVNE